MAPTSDLHDTLQDLSEILGRRLVVTDERLRVVGYSIHETEADRARLSLVLAHSDAWPVPPAGAGEQVQELPGQGQVQVIPLGDDRQRVGFLLVPCLPGEVDLPDAVRAVLADYTPTLGVLLSLRMLRAERDRTRIAVLLGDLLEADAFTRRTAAESLLKEGLLGASRQYSAVALGCDERLLSAEDDPDATIRLAVKAALDFVSHSSTASVVGAVLDDGTGVLVFPRPVVTERLHKVLDQRELMTVRAGIGPLVGDLVSIRESFRKARDAWRVGCVTRAQTRVAQWDTLGVDRLLVRLPLAELELGDLPTPVRGLLTAGLSEELIATLDAYLSCSGDVAATTSMLHIHRSTLYYRLGRIHERADVDPGDPQVRRELTIGLRIAQLAELLGGSRPSGSGLGIGQMSKNG